MSQGLATRGYISPAVGGGGGGGGGASGIAIPFEMRDADGNLVDDAPSGSEIKVSVNGAAFATGVGTITHITGGPVGAYYYELDSTEVAPNWVWLRVTKASHAIVSVVWNIDDKVTNDDLNAQTTTLGNAISAARDSVNGNVDTLPTVAEIDAQLSGAHGAGAWSGSDTAAIDAALTASHGAGSWAGLTTSATAAAVWGAIGEGVHTYGDLVRGVVGALAGTTSDYRTGTIVAKSINGAKTRWTWTVDDSGRLSVVAGDLT